MKMSLTHSHHDEDGSLEVDDEFWRLV
jgi:hypothetical protein